MSAKHNGGSGKCSKSNGLKTENSKLNENEKMTVAAAAPTATMMTSNKYNNCGETVPLNAAAQFHDCFGMCSKK